MKQKASPPLALEGTGNTRDLGNYDTLSGKRTRPGQFYRSDGLDRLTQGDQEILFDLGIRCVVDLRSREEAEKSPDKLFRPEISYYNVPMLDRMASSGFQGALPAHMGEVYRELLAESGRSFARVFQIFAAHADGGILFHCSAGKDRTGVTAMLLLSLGNVPRETIVEDYRVSEENNRPIAAQQRAKIKEAYGVELPQSLFASDPEEMEATLDYLEEQFGTAENYLLNQGVTEQELTIIKNKLLG